MKKSLVLLTALLFIYLFFLQLQAIWPFTVDDMYIPLRYAKHWAMGYGLVWNIQEAPVEGYSNFSFVVLATLTLILKGDPVIVLKIAGILGLFFTCLFIYLISRFWFNKILATLPALALLVYKGQIVWATSGLETTVYQAFLSGAVYFCFRGLGYKFYPLKRQGYNNFALFAAGLTLALAGMTRPEAAVFMAVFFVLICWDRLDGEALFKPIACYLLPLVFLYIPYFIWRWYYFGLLFPNPVYCKGLSTSPWVLDWNYLKLTWPLLLFSLVACLKIKDKRFYFLWLPSLIYLILLVGSDPVVAFYNRLFLPALILLFPLALNSMSYLLLLCFNQKSATYEQCLLACFACFIFILIPSMSLGEYRFFTQDPLLGEQLRQEIIHWLNTQVDSRDYIVLGDSGMIPYYSNAQFIDAYCLNNKTMAQYPPKERHQRFCKQVFMDKPSVIIATSFIKNGKILDTPYDACLKSLLKTNYAYKLAKKVEAVSEDSVYRYEIFDSNRPENHLHDAEH